MRGVSLEEISSATRISTRFLEALETEQWNRLPGGVFNRGFVRAVARFLGLDEESMIAEYALAANDQPEKMTLVPRPISQGRQIRWLPWLLGLLAVAAAVWLVWRLRIFSSAAQHDSPSHAARPDSAASVSLVGQPWKPGAPDSSASAPSSSATADELPLLELTVAAGKTTVVSVIADGKTVFDGKMSADQNQRFQARERLEISAADSAALFLELNGQTVAPLGPPGRPGKITLTREDLKKLLGGAN